MFVYVYSIFLIIWEILCCKFLLESFICKRKYKYKITSRAIFIGLLITYYFFVYIFYNHLGPKQIAIIVIMSLGMYLLFESHYLKILVLTILYQSLLILIDYATLLLIGFFFPTISVDILNNSNVSILVAIICKVFLLFVILILKRIIGFKSGDMMTNIEWLRLLFIPIITIVSLIAITLKFNILQNMKQDNVLIYVSLGMAGMNIIVFYLINDIMEREMIIRNEKLFHEKVKNETDMYYSISENLDNQRKRTHEFKNQIAYIFALSSKGKYNELNDYIMKLDSELKLNMDMVDTNNVIVNAILNTKYREALDKGIVFVLKVNDLSNIILSDTDIVVILSNLLNNAIEACEKSKNRVIKFKFVHEDGQLIISVKNGFSMKPIKKNKKFISNKMNPEEHGMGIQNIVEAIKRYDGKYVIDYKEEMFSFSIIILSN